MFNGLTSEQMHDIIVFFNRDFPGKQIKSIWISDGGIVRIRYKEDEKIFKVAVYQCNCEFTAHLI